MGPRSIQLVVEHYLGLAGIRGASVHTLRHTCAARLIAAGDDLEDTRAYLGHASVKTLRPYLDLDATVTGLSVEAQPSHGSDEFTI